MLVKVVFIKGDTYTKICENYFLLNSQILWCNFFKRQTKMQTAKNKGNFFCSFLMNMTLAKMGLASHTCIISLWIIFSLFSWFFEQFQWAENSNFAVVICLSIENSHAWSLNVLKMLLTRIKSIVNVQK